jgi:hypothetical protein
MECTCGYARASKEKIEFSLGIILEYFHLEDHGRDRRIPLTLLLHNLWIKIGSCGRML